MTSFHIRAEANRYNIYIHLD